MITVYIGKNRNVEADKLNGYVQADITINTNHNDLKYYTQKMLDDISSLVNHGAKNILIKNAELAFPIGFKPSYFKEKLPDINFVLTTWTHYLCWDADEIKYFGDFKPQPYDFERLKYGNVLDAYGTELLEL